MRCIQNISTRFKLLLLVHGNNDPITMRPNGYRKQATVPNSLSMIGIVCFPNRHRRAMNKIVVTGKS